MVVAITRSVVEAVSLHSDNSKRLEVERVGSCLMLLCLFTCSYVPIGSKQNLPLTQAAITARSPMHFGRLSFHSPNSEFQVMKVSVSLAQSLALPYPSRRSIFYS